MLTRMPPDAVAKALRYAEDLKGYEYREQIIAAREMQKLGLAAAPHAQLLAGRLEDPHFQLRRACAETLRLIAEIAKELHLDKEEAEADAAKAAAEAEAAVEAKRIADAEAEAAGHHRHHHGSKEHHGRSASHRMSSKRHSSGDEDLLAQDDGHHHHHHHHMHHHDEDEELPKPHRAGWFSGKDHDEDHAADEAADAEAEKAGEAEEGEERSESKRSEAHSGADDQRSDHGGSEGEESWVSSESSVQSEVVITPRSAAAMADPRSAVAPYVMHLAKCLNDERWQVRLSAARALAAIGGTEIEEEEVVDNILPLLGDDNEEVRCAGCEVFAVLGPEAGPNAATRLVVIIDGSSKVWGEDMRVQAIKTLRAMGKNVPAKCQHMKVLCRVMQEDSSDSVRLEAANSIAHAGRAAVLFKAELLEAVMNDPCIWVKQNAIDAIVMLGSTAVTQLAAALECNDIEVRRLVVNRLMLRTADLLEVQSEARKPIIAEMVKKKMDAQEEYFTAKKRKKDEEKAIFRKERREKAKKNDDDTPEDTDEEDNIYDDSEDMVPEDDMVTGANQEFDATLISYIERVAAKLMDPDEEMREVAVGALKLLSAVVEPSPGRQVLVWQQGLWKVQSLENCDKRASSKHTVGT